MIIWASCNSSDWESHSNLTGGFHFVKLGLDLVSGAMMRGRFVASPATKGEYHEVHAQGRIAS